MVIERLKTGLWFLKRPSHWAHAGALLVRKFRENRDRHELRQAAGRWAQEQAISAADALEQLGLKNTTDSLPAIPEQLLARAAEQAASSRVRMGGPGHLELIYAAATLSRAMRAVETGVAYGWSSLAVLAALKDGRGRLVSVDMPYVKAGNEPWVGIVVPDELRADWTLVREPDRYGLVKAIRLLGGQIDFAHYDSDKSYWGRRYAYPRLWSALRPDGVFISDDIQDNFAFRDFCRENDVNFRVCMSDGKFVGIAVKKA